MEFLQTLAKLATDNKLQVDIHIEIENDLSVCSVVPKTKTKTYTPFVMRGTPEELDQEFETHVEALATAMGYISNAASYAETIKKEVEEAAKKATPAKKPEVKKPEPKKPDAGRQTHIPPKKAEQPKPAPKPPKPEPKKVEVEEKDDDDSIFGDD